MNAIMDALAAHSTMSKQALDSERVRKRLWKYERRLRRIRPLVDGAYLKSLGLKPSPLFSRLLNAVRDARLDGLLQTEGEEKSLIARLLAERRETKRG